MSELTKNQKRILIVFEEGDSLSAIDVMERVALLRNRVSDYGSFGFFLGLISQDLAEGWTFIASGSGMVYSNLYKLEKMRILDGYWVDVDRMDMYYHPDFPRRRHYRITQFGLKTQNWLWPAHPAQTA